MSESKRIDLEIQRLFALAKDTEISDDLRSVISRYICVLASSYLEASLRETIADFIRTRTSGSVISFTDFHLRRIPNPSIQSIIDLVGRFGKRSRNEFEKAFNERQRSAIDSIHSNRTKIAHGPPTSVNLSVTRMKQYYDDARDVVKTIGHVLKRSSYHSRKR